MMPRLRLAFTTMAATLAYLGLAVLGWGGFAAFFSHSALIALAITLFVLSGVAVFSGGNLSAGVREDRANRWVLVAFGVIGLLQAFLPAWTDRKGFWTLDGDAIRWLGVVLFGRRGCAADLASLRARPSVQRVGGHPAWAYTGHEWCLWRHPPSQLPGVARQLAGMGPRISFGGRRAAHGAPYSAAPRAHSSGREAAASAVRRAARCILQPHVTADPVALLRQQMPNNPPSPGEVAGLVGPLRSTA